MTEFVGDSVHWRLRSSYQEFPSSIRDLQMCSGQEVMKERQMCIRMQSYSCDKFVSNFWDAVQYAGFWGALTKNAVIFGEG